MIKLEVKPLISVGEVEFGMPREKVRQLFGAFSEFRKTPNSAKTTDDLHSVMFSMTTMIAVKQSRYLTQKYLSIIKKYSRAAQVRLNLYCPIPRKNTEVIWI